MFRKAMLAGIGIVLMATPASADKGLDAVKSFMIGHGDRMMAESNKMTAAAQSYYDIIKGAGFDYAKAAKSDGPKIKSLLEAMKDAWIKSHDNYENIEGIVAGIPHLAKYDLIIDAGGPGTEKEDVAPFDMPLPDGTVMKKPGNIYHMHLETALWGTNPKKVGAKLDLDGDGEIELGEVLPEANITLGASQAHTKWTAAMLKDVKAWNPNFDDAFTAVVTMTPTVGDYFGEWKESKFITGDIGMFVAQTRLIDVKGIMRSCKVMYNEGLSSRVAAKDPILDAKIKMGFLELLDFVNEVYLNEKAGVKYPPEQTDKLGSEAQDIADRIVAMVTQAAKKTGAKLKL
jgi:Imelysin